MKSLFSSKTFWIATAQAVLGVIVAFSTSYPDIGGLIVAKSVIDIAIRFLTTTPVTL